MKYTNTIAAVTIALMSAATAATTVTVQNFDVLGRTVGLAITDNSGNPLTGVNFGVGTFSGDFATAEDIKLNFNVLGTGTTADTPEFVAPASVAISPQDDSPVYVVFYGNATNDGTAANLADAADFIVISGPGSFVDEDPVLNSANVGNIIADGTVEYGQARVTDTSGIAVPVFQTALANGVTFGNVPEPSSALLSLVGLAFVARRRR